MLLGPLLSKSWEPVALLAIIRALWMRRQGWQDLLSACYAWCEAKQGWSLSETRVFRTWPGGPWEEVPGQALCNTNTLSHYPPGDCAWAVTVVHIVQWGSPSGWLLRAVPQEVDLFETQCGLKERAHKARLQLWFSAVTQQRNRPCLDQPDLSARGNEIAGETCPSA